MKTFDPTTLSLTKYLFFTGKGGVGKTTSACATAVTLADTGKKVMLVSTDPASNLQDVFQTKLTNKPKTIAEIPNLQVANFDPVTAADEYKEAVVAPYRGILPDSAVENMEEQLSGSCTVEIAAFNEFAGFLTNAQVADDFDYVIFDTAPTGHTLRMLALPSAWTNYLDENTTGVSCLGQLSGLGEKRESYAQAVKTLSDGTLTTLLLVTRPQKSAIYEAERASKELAELGIKNQKLVVNGLLENPDDAVSQHIFAQQQEDLTKISADFDCFSIPLRAYNITGLENLRHLLATQQPEFKTDHTEISNFPDLSVIVENYISTNKKIIFTMGKGGVGKTTIAVKMAQAFADKGKKVRLATTDPADHLSLYLQKRDGISVSPIDEERELALYKAEVIAKARENLTDDNLDYIKEDLESPCTQEIAVFRAFAEIVAKADDEIVVIDTAPTGHTLLLLESTQNYAKEIERTNGEVPVSIQKLLPRLQNPDETEVLMVTLPETTPVLESMRLAKDLDRAKIAHTWWLVNQSMLATQTTNKILKARAESEREWIDKVAELSTNHFAVAKWLIDFENEN